MDRFFKFMQGRHTSFAAAFFVSGTALHAFHRLDTTYISFMATLMSFVLGHSVKEDYFSKPDSSKSGS